MTMYECPECKCRWNQGPMRDVRTDTTCANCTRKVIYERDYLKARMEQVRSKLSMTKVPYQKWVKVLHGELFMLAQDALDLGGTHKEGMP